MWIDVLKAALFLGFMGLILGGILNLAAKYFYVKEDKRKEKILEILPGVNCGGCGYASCSDYADALVTKHVPCNKCQIAGGEGTQKIAAVLGVMPDEFRPMVAHIRCQGSNDFANKKYIYYGMNDCEAASRLLGGYMTCQYGCLGFGNCVKKCPENAINVQKGVAVVDRDICNGCGICLSACPKNVIELMPRDINILINCASKDKGSRTREACNIGCVGCKNCEKSCPQGAIHVRGNVSVIDYERCIGCGICAENCPRSIIEMAAVHYDES